MATGKESRESSERAENSPVAWFAVLEEARARNDQRGIDRAVRELKRLGVAVTFGEGAKS